MKRDYYDDDFPVYGEDLWEEAPLDEDPRRPRRRHRRARRRRRSHTALWLFLSVLVGVGIGLLLQSVVVRGVLRVLPFPWQRFSSQGDGDYDEGFGFGHSGDVENNADAGEGHSIPAYNQDSSGLTIELQPAAGPEETGWDELYQKLLPSTVSITVYAEDRAAYGSGMVLTEDGYLLTCAHVIDNTDSASVTTSSGEQYEAALVGSDAQTDLAVLKIDAEGLKPVVFTDSRELNIGQEICTIGDPLGPQFRGSLTTGIVSGLDRQISSNGYAMTLIQITAAVNSGNSGCPLFTREGQVAGVVNMKMSSRASAASIDNMGLAVPSTTVKEIVETLADEGVVNRLVLGISCYAINETTARLYGMPEGLRVATIDPNSHCGEAGLLVGDIITEVNGTPVRSVNDFREATANFSAEDAATLTVWRDKNQPPEDASASASTSASASASAEWEPDSYDYEYFGEISVQLIPSTELSE